jgi:hypothetical protein
LGIQFGGTSILVFDGQSVMEKSVVFSAMGDYNTTFIAEVKALESVLELIVPNKLAQIDQIKQQKQLEDKYSQI